MVDDGLSAQSSDCGTNTIGHNHEETLCTTANRLVGLLVNIESTRNVEEIESHTVNHTREYKENHAWHTGIAHSEEAETEHPCKHCYEHHVFDSETFHAERDEQDTQCFTDL